MSDNEPVVEEVEVDVQGEAVEPSKDELNAQELTSLKAKADMIGMKYHPNIGLDKLKKRVNEQLTKDKAQLAKEAKEAKKALEVDKVVAPEETLPTVPQTTKFDSPVGGFKETPAQRKMRMVKKAKRLIRFRLTCMNEAKKKWPAEIFTVSNSVIGTIKRAIPFNADSWHCEEMLLNMIQDRKFVTYFEVKGKKGRTYKKTKLVKEFAIEILPPLTSKEIDDLIKRQGLADNLGDD